MQVMEKCVLKLRTMTNKLLKTYPEHDGQVVTVIGHHRSASGILIHRVLADDLWEGFVFEDEMKKVPNTHPD
jgi:hypothetical protein